MLIDPLLGRDSPANALIKVVFPAVRAEQGKKFTGLNCKTDIIERHQGAELFTDCLDRNGAGHGNIKSTKRGGL